MYTCEHCVCTLTDASCRNMHVDDKVRQDQTDLARSDEIRQIWQDQTNLTRSDKMSNVPEELLEGWHMDPLPA